jgi:hypothetical protein
MALNIDRSFILWTTGGLAFFLVMSKLTRDRLIHTPDTLGAKGGRDFKKDLADLDYMPNYGNEATAKSIERPDLLDRTGYLAGMDNTFRDPQSDLKMRPAQYWTGDVPSTVHNPIFPGK